MRTDEDRRQYAREYYKKNYKSIKERNETYSNTNADRNREEEKRLSKALGARVSVRKKYNEVKERRRQEEITNLWRLTGEFILPDDKYIDKIIEKEIIKQEHIEDDVVDYIELDECIENNEDEDEIS